MEIQQGRRQAPPFVRWMDRLNGLITKLCGVAMGLMVLSVFFGVLVRFVFTYAGYRLSVPWTEEVSRYLMIWTIFLGGAVAARRGKLIGVQFLVHALPSTLGRSLKYAALIVSMVFYALLCVVGWQWVKFSASTTSPVLELPMSVITPAMFVGGLVMGLNTIALLIEARHFGRDIRTMAEDDDLSAALKQFRHEDSHSPTVVSRVQRTGSTA
jgi:TRAP-type C4-dicarboxylate transport system permease small subunit